MTVTTSVSALETAAARESALGNYAYAAALALEASQNALAVPASGNAQQMRVAVNTSAQIAAVATDAASAQAYRTTSQNTVFQHGQDGARTTV